MPLVDTANRSSQTGPQCCTMLQFGTKQMAAKYRLSVNLTLEEHLQVEALAESAGISKAWLGRRAVVEFLERWREGELQLPLDIAKPQPREMER